MLSLAIVVGSVFAYVYLVGLAIAVIVVPLYLLYLLARFFFVFRG